MTQYSNYLLHCLKKGRWQMAESQDSFFMARFVGLSREWLVAFMQRGYYLPTTNTAGTAHPYHAANWLTYTTLRCLISMAARAFPKVRLEASSLVPPQATANQKVTIYTNFFFSRISSEKP